MTRMVRCRRGCRHWGPYGAAGLLLRYRGEGGPLYLLQLRSLGVHRGGTWSIPGGALLRGEDPLAGALREASEELGWLPELPSVSAVVTDDHGWWAYHTVVVDVAERFEPGGGWEGFCRWCTADEVTGLRLHPGLAAMWPRLALSR